MFVHPHVYLSRMVKRADEGKRQAVYRAHHNFCTSATAAFGSTDDLLVSDPRGVSYLLCADAALRAVADTDNRDAHLREMHAHFDRIPQPTS